MLGEGSRERLANFFLPGFLLLSWEIFLWISLWQQYHFLGWEAFLLKSVLSCVITCRYFTWFPCGKGSSSPSAAEVPTCKRGKGPSYLSSQNFPAEWPTPPSLPDGTTGGHCLGRACKKHATFSEQPHSRKGHQWAASAIWQAARGRDGWDWQPGMCLEIWDVPSRPRLPSTSMCLLYWGLSIV